LNRTTRAGRRLPSPTTAAFLSFLWPGLGQLYLRSVRSAAIYGLPVLAGALVLLLIAKFVGGLDVLAVHIFVPQTAIFVILLSVVLGGWRLGSMAHAFRGGVVEQPRHWRSQVLARQAASRHQRSLRIFLVLAGIVVLTHGAIAWAAYAFYDAGTRIFVNEPGGPVSRPNPSSGLAIGGGPIESPHVTPPTRESRINMLLVGADSGLGYNHSLTDTMILVTIDPSSRSVALLSLPRDLGRLPMYSGGTYPGKLNSIVSTADAHPADYPDGGIGTLSREVGFLVGAPVHYFAYINLAGFKELIDGIGGVDVVNERAISDAGYQFPDGKVGFYLATGLQHLDGRTALAYVRSRNGPGDNDFTRAARQQQLLLALRTKLANPAMLPKIPSLLDALANTIQTNFPADRLGDMIQLAKSTSDDNVERVVLGPPYARRPSDASTYILVPDLEMFAALSIRLFGPDSTYTTGEVPSR